MSNTTPGKHPINLLKVTQHGPQSAQPAKPEPRAVLEDPTAEIMLCLDERQGEEHHEKMVKHTWDRVFDAADETNKKRLHTATTAHIPSFFKGTGLFFFGLTFAAALFFTSLVYLLTTGFSGEGDETFPILALIASGAITAWMSMVLLVAAVKHSDKKNSAMNARNFELYIPARAKYSVQLKPTLEPTGGIAVVTHSYGLARKEEAHHLSRKDQHIHDMENLHRGYLQNSYTVSAHLKPGTVTELEEQFDAIVEALAVREEAEAALYKEYLVKHHLDEKTAPTTLKNLRAQAQVIREQNAPEPKVNYDLNMGYDPSPYPRRNGIHSF